MTQANGNLELYDGNTYLIDAATTYSEERQLLEYIQPSIEYIKYNANGIHQPSTRHFDGNKMTYGNADGNVPSRPYKDLIFNGALINELLSIDSWPEVPNENVFAFRNKFGEVDLVIAYPHDGSTVKYHMFAFNDRRYKLDPYYNLRWVTKFINANIIHRPAIPVTTVTKEPHDATLALLSYETCHMLRGELQLYKIDGKYYDRYGHSHYTLALASEAIRENIVDINTGKSYSNAIPDYIVYEANSNYDSYGDNDDIAYSNSRSYVILRRNEYKLKGPAKLLGKYYWCVLEFYSRIDNNRSLYRITYRKPIDIRLSRSKQLLVVKSHNKELTVSRSTTTS